MFSVFSKYLCNLNFISKQNSESFYAHFNQKFYKSNLPIIILFKILKGIVQTSEDIKNNTRELNAQNFQKIKNYKIDTKTHSISSSHVQWINF